MKKLTSPIFSTGFFIVSTLLASWAFADAPQYYVDGAISGTATIKAEGSCSMDEQIFPGAHFGNVFNSGDEALGWGVISADGQLLAIIDALAVGGIWRASSGDEFSASGYMGAVVDKEFLAAQTGCSVDSVIPATKSKFHYAAGGSQESLAMKGVFAGYADVGANCRADDDGTVCRAHKFSGVISFQSDP